MAGRAASGLKNSRFVRKQGIRLFVYKKKAAFFYQAKSRTPFYLTAREFMGAGPSPAENKKLYYILLSLKAK